jgi:hypothetical protein
MGKLRVTMFLILLVLGLIHLPQSLLVQAQSGTGPSIWIDPQDIGSQDINATFTVYLRIDNALNVEGIQAQFTYDPLVLNVTRVVEGPFLLSVGSTALAQLYAEENREAQPPTGEVFYSSALTTGAMASGSGVLLNVTFRVISQGAAKLHLIPYGHAGSAEIGTFYVDLSFAETYPSLHDSYYGTPISIFAYPDVIYNGQNTTLLGQVSGASGGSVQSITLEFNEEGGSWSTLATLAINGSGFYTYQYTGNGTADLTIYEFRVSYQAAGQTYYSPLTVLTVVASSPLLIGYVYDAIIIVIIIIIALIIVSIVKKRRRHEILPPVL